MCPHCGCIVGVCRVFCARFVVFLSWQVNYVLAEKGHSTVPFAFAMTVCILVSTVGLDAFAVRDPVPVPSRARGIRHCATRP
jgi:hypothetical protein